jgi:hypothetical protein
MPVKQLQFITGENMTDNQKLEALCRHAVQNDFSGLKDVLTAEGQTRLWATLDHMTVTMRIYRGMTLVSQLRFGLFDKNFARALFGDTDMCINCGKQHIHPNGVCDIGYGFELPANKYYVQQAATSDDPIDYMYKVVFV